MTPKEHNRLRHEEEKLLRKQSKRKRLMPKLCSAKELQSVINQINEEAENGRSN